MNELGRRSTLTRLTQGKHGPSTTELVSTDAVAVLFVFLYLSDNRSRRKASQRPAIAAIN